ncbi:carotenoid biosynthesis protein [Nocardia sp. ET3-3]|uniref:Carotenoid biosynthesis protein n=1 Tax=Nocardia terrae TaxID=2675851 RepID=A0A7K1V6P3_9NOCA|nr:carotenoid biosynthesis protein [Nocardia terrae]MVU82159.1 carotenoid biosynthesis protein [Nocardia terrae]
MSARRAAALAAAPAIVLVLVQITYPLTHGAGRDRVTVVVVLVSAGTALVHAGITRGMLWATGLLVILSGIGLAAEVLGTATGFPFGCYAYASGRLGPALMGVPLVVPLAWTGGLYPVWTVAGIVSHGAMGRLSPGVTRVALTAVGAVGWDLFLDPQMVADGQWAWRSGVAGLPGLGRIPVTNYAGWFVVALVMAGLLEWWDRRGADSGAARIVPVAVFVWTWLGSTLAHAVFLGLPVSAVYGFCGLGVLGFPLLRELNARRITLGPRPHGTM